MRIISDFKSAYRNLKHIDDTKPKWKFNVEKFDKFSDFMTNLGFILIIPVLYAIVWALDYIDGFIVLHIVLFMLGYLTYQFFERE